MLPFLIALVCITSNYFFFVSASSKLNFEFKYQETRVACNLSSCARELTPVVLFGSYSIKQDEKVVIDETKPITATLSLGGNSGLSERAFRFCVQYNHSYSLVAYSRPAEVGFEMQERCSYPPHGFSMMIAEDAIYTQATGRYNLTEAFVEVVGDIPDPVPTPPATSHAGSVAAGVLIPLIVIGAGLGYYWWRRRKNRLAGPRFDGKPSSRDGPHIDLEPPVREDAPVLPHDTQNSSSSSAEPTAPR